MTQALVSIPDTGTLHEVLAQVVATIVLGLLGASGTVKLVDPTPTTGAMRVAGLPSSDILSRVLGVTEIVVAVVALSIGGFALVGGAVLYTGFAVFTFRAVRKRLPLQSCGCFGREDTPPTSFHSAYNAVAALALVTVAALDRVPIDWTSPLTELVLYLGFTAVGVYLSYLLLTLLPRLRSSWETR